MNTKSYINSSLIAPCGMNCGICMAFLREKKKCLNRMIKHFNKGTMVVEKTLEKLKMLKKK